MFFMLQLKKKTIILKSLQSERRIDFNNKSEQEYSHQFNFYWL